jgi:hypothetical protein
MLIKVDIDISGALTLTDLLLKKIPYATNNALSRTARELVELERGELKSEFHVRKQFILDRVQVMKWPRPDSLWARVGINQKVQGGDLLLTMFEEGGEKIPELGTELAVPPTGGAVRPDMAQPMSPRLLYKSLHMQRFTTSRGAIQYKGGMRTFIVPGMGVFQRTTSRQRKARGKKGVAGGKGADENIVLLYSFKHGVPLRAQMHFVRTAREFVVKRFPQIWREEFAREMAGRRK